jgi:hypothetical protein
MLPYNGGRFINLETAYSCIRLTPPGAGHKLTRVSKKPGGTADER